MINNHWEYPMGKDCSWNMNVSDKVLICDLCSTKSVLGLPRFNHSNDDALFFYVPQAAFTFDYMEKKQNSQRQ